MSGEESFALALCDGRVYTLWKELVDKLRGKAPLIILPEGENAKELPVLRRLWKKLWQYQVDKGQTILCIGGGSTLDVCGFAAATWKRGIPFVSVPSTLIAQIDAAFGGKVGINFKKGKNLIGTYTQPKAIWVYPGFLHTLPPPALRAGWVEAYKHALIEGGTLQEEVHSTSFRTIPSLELLRRLVQVKERLVAEDPYEEQGRRQVLNLGHTLGHVWESLSLQTEKPLLHGEAVAIGLVQELYVSVKRGELAESFWMNVVGKWRTEGLLLPLPPFTWRIWEKFLLQDKKIRDGRIFLPLFLQGGRIVLSAVSIDELRFSIKAYKELIS
ncbi:MAG: 3-dehydroquinate synthase family protein [Bacteroidia bacterium]|nr:3-dehydroquinate synthase [Bacteroidia bacterium]MDW8015228.1 3-dehydroquinate synthase family protein [Bacteroidia bacterium]